MNEELLIKLGRQLVAYIGEPRCGLSKKNTYKLVCLEHGEERTRFSLLDPSGGNCGEITIPTEHLHAFSAMNWKGLVRWNGKQ